MSSFVVGLKYSLKYFADTSRLNSARLAWFQLNIGTVRLEFGCRRIQEPKGLSSIQNLLLNNFI